MSLWDWIWQKLTQPVAADPAGRDRQSGGANTATAVADPDQADPSAERWWTLPEANLIELLAPDRPLLSTEALALENRLIEQLDGHDLSLPPLPRVPERVLRRLRKRTASMKDVAEDIGEDQVITAAVLRLANSPLYRGREQITGLTPAVVRLGNNAVRMLMLHESLRSVTLASTGPIAELAATHWLEAQASGYVMRSLSRFTGLDPEEAFLIGLLQNIGNVIVLRTAQQQYRIAGFALSNQEFDYLCHECHQEFGELIAEAWNLPPDLQSLIRNHHDYPADDDPLRTHRLSIHLSQMICSLLEFAPWQPYDLLATRAVRDLGLIDQPDFEAFLADLPDSLAELLDK